MFRYLRVTVLELDSMRENQLLGYLDLTHWANVNDFEISQNCLGLALFPSEFEVALNDRVRKVIVPLAKRVTQDSFLTTLRAQALRSAPGEKRDPKDVTEEDRLIFLPAGPRTN